MSCIQLGYLFIELIKEILRQKVLQNGLSIFLKHYGVCDNKRNKVGRRPIAVSGTNFEYDSKEGWRQSQNAIPGLISFSIYTCEPENKPENNSCEISTKRKKPRLPDSYVLSPRIVGISIKSDGSMCVNAGAGVLSSPANVEWDITPQR